MRFKLFEENEYISTNYIFSVPVVIYNEPKDTGDLISKLSYSILENVNENLKFIKESLGIDVFEISFKEFNNPSLSFLVHSNKSIDTPDFIRVLKRYLKADVESDNGRAVTVSEWTTCSEYFEPID